MALLEVEGLSAGFDVGGRTLTAVEDVSFAVQAGSVLGVVGESGSGKSVTALSILGLLPEPAGRILAGSVRLDGRDLTELPRSELERVRGREVGMVFQDPLTSLNPTLTVGEQIAEVLRRHLGWSRRQARERAIELLAEVRIPDPRRRVDDYPHRFSGGMRQRVTIAAAIACNPRLLIADEPTTALDVTVQRQILELLAALQQEHGMAMVLITHDMGVIAHVTDDVVVMYAGQVVESGRTGELFELPEHPYTEALLDAMPSRLRGTASPRELRFRAIPGQPPALGAMPPGCRFAPRCRYAGAGDPCPVRRPPLREIRPGHLARTFHARSERDEP